MASVRQKNGKWYYRITLTVGDGSHKYIERGSWTNKREALEAGRQAEQLYKNGYVDIRKKNLTFSFLSEEWLGICDKKYKPKSIIHYKEILNNYILPKIKDFNILAISTKQCQDIIDVPINKHKSYSRIYHTKIVLSNIFNYAIQQGYMRDNPAKGVILPSKRTRLAQTLNHRSENKIVSKSVLEAIFKRFPKTSTPYIPLLLGYKAGLRIGEVFGLFVEDFDYNNKVLHIRRQLQFDENGKLFFTNPKYCNPGEGRDVILDENTCRVLRQRIELLIANTIPMGYKQYFIDQNGYLNEDSGTHIFPLNYNLNTGEILTPRSLIYAGRVIHGKESTIDVVDPDWCFHNLRHTHASECLAAGMSPVSVQKRLGHRSLNTTFKTYIHETEIQVTASRDILEKMYNKILY